MTEMKTHLLLLALLLMFFSYNGISQQTGFAEVNGTKLYFEVAGKGEPIIFVHGNFGDRRHWDKQFEPLSKKFRVVRYDVRGFGKSAMPKPEESYSNWDDLKALMDYLKIDKAHVCGLSMGSGIAVDFALVYPEKCLSVIPIGPWGSGFGEGNFKSPNADSLFVVFTQVRKLLGYGELKEAVDYIWTGNQSLAHTVKDKDTRKALLEMGYDYTFWSWLNQSKIQSLNPTGMDRLKEIKLPTLIVIGEYDHPCCIEVADIMKKEIKGSKLVTIKNAGHIMNMDKPEEFNNELIKFIDNLHK
jgi:pimeloyl-ACP methyl ester carboxylesterase